MAENQGGKACPKISRSTEPSAPLTTDKLASDARKYPRAASTPLGRVGRRFAEPLMQNPKQLCGLGCYVTALDELGVSLEDFKCRGVAFGPEADVQFMLSDAKVTHR